jgi:SpoVK/Ycf46/Vps4 family AAA+-type ATPase
MAATAQPMEARELTDLMVGHLKHWVPANDTRYPWARKSVADAIRQWMVEAENADVLHAAGERVLPLLLTGETRCGKTSTMVEVARHYDVPAFRMTMGQVVGQYMGETIRGVKAALDEAASAATGLWILDEVDGIFQQRGGGDNSGCAHEWNAAIGQGLAAIESLPAHVMLVATTNEPAIIDRAMLARFCRVDFPPWSELTEPERRAFARSHKHEDAWTADSYAGVVQAARAARVKKILGHHDTDR